MYFKICNVISYFFAHQKMLRNSNAIYSINVLFDLANIYIAYKYSLEIKNWPVSEISNHSHQSVNRLMWNRKRKILLNIYGIFNTNLGKFLLILVFYSYVPNYHKLRSLTYYFMVRWDRCFGMA